MKRIAMATVVLTALAVGAQAGGLPKPIRLVERLKMYDLTHYLRGAEPGKGGGGSQSSSAEARQAAPAPRTADQQKTEPKPKPAKAD